MYEFLTVSVMYIIYYMAAMCGCRRLVARSRAHLLYALFSLME